MLLHGDVVISNLAGVAQADFINEAVQMGSATEENFVTAGKLQTAPAPERHGVCTHCSGSTDHSSAASAVINA